MQNRQGWELETLKADVSGSEVPNSETKRSITEWWTACPTDSWGAWEPGM